jgi:hypothetical protein
MMGPKQEAQVQNESSTFQGVQDGGLLRWPPRYYVEVDKVNLVKQVGGTFEEIGIGANNRSHIAAPFFIPISERARVEYDALWVVGTKTLA